MAIDPHSPYWQEVNRRNADLVSLRQIRDKMPDEPLECPRDDATKQLLEHLGDDAAKWAAEFRKTAISLGYSDMDQGWLTVWFANAIEHSWELRRKRNGDD